MFEFEHADRSLAPRLTLSDHAGSRSEFAPEHIASYSLESWGEHCTECAFPSCYSTCSFYSPRQDGRCRRFTFGILRSTSPTSWMGYSAFVEFKNWSMFWTQGNATQLPKPLSALLQGGGGAAWSLSSPVDKLLHKITGRKRVSLVLQSLRRRIIRQIGQMYGRFPKPDCFLLEIYNPMAGETQLRLWMRGEDTANPSRFEWTGRAAKGMSSFVIPVSDIERWLDLSRPFDMGLTLRDEDRKSLFVLSAAFVRLAARPAPVAAPTLPAVGERKVKCLVWDLDHTLWDGVLVESDSAPRLKDGVRAVLEELDRRGILLSIASKNSLEDARGALTSLGIWDLFLAPQIGWHPKSASVKRIAEQLNIGLDSIAVIDDMPFERDEITSTLPGVRTLPEVEYLSILGRPEFAGDSSDEGSSRRHMYRTEMSRHKALADSRLGYDSFLATCDIRVSIERPGDALLPRIDDIVQRTNQLNIASKRYTLEELQHLIHGRECDCYVVSCEDKYGAYGHVGFIVMARDRARVLIRDCMFSCRIQGKRIDEAILAHLINQYLGDGVTEVQARFNPTKRNAPAGEMLRRLGFAAAPGLDGVLSLNPAAPRDEVKYVRIAGASTTSCVLS